MPGQKTLAFALVALLLATASLPTGAAAEQLVLLGAHLIPIDSPEIPDGVLVLDGGRIAALGRRGEVEIPDGAEIRDLAGKVVMPGLVDTHSHIGGGSGGDDSGPIQPEVRIADAFDVRDPGIARARAGGLTTVNVMPGSSHLASGQTLYLKLRRGETLEDLALPDGRGGFAGGLKMANGTNSRKDPPFPGTRGKAAALVRAAFLEARDYQAKKERHKDDPGKRPAVDLGLETLVEVLEGKRVVHHHTHRHDDVLTVLRLQQEFGFRVVLHHVSEGWRVASQIAAAGAPVSLIVVDSPGGKLEAKDLRLDSGALLEEAGVAVGFHTDDGITDSRLFLRMAALAVRAGMSRQGALEGLTIAGARMLDLDSRVGSLTVGKDADFVVLSGDPLSIYTHVLETWIDGAKVFDRGDPADRLFAVGGWGAGSTRDGHADHECFAEEVAR